MEILLSLVWIYFAAVCACTDESIFGSWAAERLQNIGKGYDDSCRVLEGGRAPRSLGTVVRKDVNLFLFQNDEKELLPDWLQYHAYLFGTKSLHIIDHNSTDLQVCKLLALYKHCGSTVTNYVGDFSGKRGVLSDHMHKYKSSFLIPLDADEFIVSFKKDDEGNKIELIINRDTILNEIESSPIDGRKYKFNGSYPVRHDADKCEAALNGTAPLSANDRRVMAGGYEDPTPYRQIMQKSFYYSDGFIATDQGNHFGEVVHDKGAHGRDARILANITHYFHLLPSVSLLHFTACSYEHLKAKILRGARVYGFDEKHVCHPDEHGAHYCKVAKDFRLGTPHSRDYFRLCAHKQQGGQCGAYQGMVCPVCADY